MRVATPVLFVYRLSGAVAAGAHPFHANLIERAFVTQHVSVRGFVFDVATGKLNEVTL